MPSKLIADGSYDRIAPIYDLLDLPFEWLFYRNMRKKWIGGLRNQRVLEVGGGMGKNRAHYHSSNRVTVIDRSRRRMVRAAKRLKKLEEGSIELSYQAEPPWSIPHDFTIAVATFVLCTIKNPFPVLEEIR